MLTTTVQGVEIPSLGLGTWQVEGEECVEAVRDALELGYRHVDTARAYGNEAEVGRGLRASGVDRDDVWVTTKVWRDDIAPDRIRGAAEASLADLGLDVVDLLLLHWPQPAAELGPTLETLTAVRDAGLTRHIGVSNFPPALLREAAALAPILCDQVEYHPYLSQEALLEVAGGLDVLVTAYSPIAQGEVLTDPVVEGVARDHGVSPAQVVLRWLVDQPRVAAIPRSRSARNRRSNLDIDSVALTDDERKALDGLARGRRLIDPPWAPDWAA